MSESIGWKAHWTLEKFHAGIEDVYAGQRVSSTNGRRRGEAVVPYEVVDGVGNLLMAGGADVLWLGLKGSLTTTTGQAGTVFSGTAKGTSIGVGNSTTAAAITQTNLQGASKLRKKVDTGYPTHTTGTAGTTQQKMLFRATFSTSQANYAWQEWGVFNSSVDASGRMLNRKVESLGTKTSSATWTFTVTLSLA